MKLDDWRFREPHDTLSVSAREFAFSARTNFDYICYVPMPRCASTSIKQGLQSAGILSKSFIHDVPQRNGLIVARPSLVWNDVCQWRWWQMFWGDRGEIPNRVERDGLKLFLWTVVRNPYSRVVSAWKLALKEGWLHPSTHKDATLEEFLSLMFATLQDNISVVDGYPAWFKNGRHGSLLAPKLRQADANEMFLLEGVTREGLESMWGHTISVADSSLALTDHQRWHKEDQQTFTCGVSGLANMYVNGLVHGIVPSIPRGWRTPLPFHTVKFENLHSDFGILCRFLGWPEIELPHLNKIQKDDFMSYHNEKTIQLTNIFYDYEFSTFYSEEKVNL